MVRLELNHVISFRWEPFPLTDLLTGAIQHSQELRIYVCIGQRSRVWDGTVGLGRQEELREVRKWHEGDRFWLGKTWHYLGNRLAAGTHVWVGTEA